MGKKENRKCLGVQIGREPLLHERQDNLGLTHILLSSESYPPCLSSLYTLFIFIMAVR